MSYHQCCEIKVWCAKCFVLHKMIVAIELATLGAFGPSCYGHPSAPCSTYFCPENLGAVFRSTDIERRPNRYLAIACPLFHLSQALTASPCFPQIHSTQKQAAPLSRSNLSLSYWKHVSCLHCPRHHMPLIFCLTRAGLYPFFLKSFFFWRLYLLRIAKDDLTLLLLPLPQRMLGL